MSDRTNKTQMNAACKALELDPVDIDIFCGYESDNMDIEVRLSAGIRLIHDVVYRIAAGTISPNDSNTITLWNGIKIYSGTAVERTREDAENWMRQKGFTIPGEKPTSTIEGEATPKQRDGALII